MRIATRLGAAVGLALLATLALTSAAPGPPPAASVHADVDDFVIDSFDAIYELGRDESGRSTLRTTERIVAVFPEVDQNRGLIRDLVRVYDGHDTDIRVISVTDERGMPRAFTTESYEDFLAVTIAVPVGSFVHGAQTYVIEYTQRDVTRYFENTGSDEFYWDTNGTGWRQPFGRVSARIVLAPELVPALNGDVACYRGRFGSDDPCTLIREGEAFVVTEHELRSRENVTIAIGFAPGTFQSRPFSLFDAVPPLIFGGLLSGVGGIVYGIVRAIRGRRGARTGNPIIAQFEPPPDIEVAVSAQLLKVPQKAMTATLLELAVLRRVRLLRDAARDRWGIQAVDREYRSTAERIIYTQLFGTARAVMPESDQVVWFGSSRYALGDAAVALNRSAASQVTDRGLVGKPAGKSIGIVAILFALALLLPLIHSIVTGDEMVLILTLAVGLQIAIWGVIGYALIVGSQRPRTMAGALVHDHLMGLREFIRVAEADRIRMLQSATGAEVDENFIVRIYERLLPYAVLFGFEREWQAELARYYRDASPDWMGGSAGSFTAVPMTSFEHYVSSSPATPSSSDSGSSSFSSSSGGSSGGGSSGGGGGGGGGRGI